MHQQHQQQLVTDMLGRRRDRAIAIVLGVKERECDDHLPDYASRKLRKVVLDQFNDFHDFCMDIVRSLDTDVLNQVYLERLDSIYEAISRLEDAASPNG